MKLAYLVNQYPQPSHSFIRREIAAIEAAGHPVARHTVRRTETPLVDPRDRAEQTKTRALLDAGAVGLLAATLVAALTRPMRFFRVLRAAFRLGRRSERGRPMHLVYLAEACLLRRRLAEQSITHLHVHFGTNSTTVALLTRLLGGPPFSFTSHGPEEYDKPQFIALTAKIHAAAFVVAISDFGKSQLFRWCDHSQWPKIHVVHCGLDDQFLSADITPPPSAPRLVNIGRLSEQKGQLLLIEAAARLARDNVDFHLTLVGDGELRPALESAIAEHHLADRVTLAGWRTGEQVRQTLLDSRALVLPSFAEGLPVVMMESLALHRPVIGTAIAGVPELVEPGVSGWLIPPGSVERLVEAMRSALAATPERLTEMGAAGAATVAKNHTAATEARRLIELIEGYSNTPGDARAGDRDGGGASC